jgi:SAM-dependent methyltransferase
VKNKQHDQLRPTERFSDRVENYRKYRPHYPDTFIPFLAGAIGLKPSSVIADIGSGTGISSELFLKNGNEVFGVEPNKEMREAGEEYLSPYPKFHGINGTAERTTLSDASIDILIAGQAFHWFSIEETKAEFTRILKQDGWAVLFWNERLLDASLFLKEYEDLLLHYGVGYPVVHEKDIKENIRQLFSEQGFTFQLFPNSQSFDYDGLQGRLLSSSYAPKADSPDYLATLAELERIFGRHQENGKIEMLYQTEVSFGHPG